MINSHKTRRDLLKFVLFFGGLAHGKALNNISLNHDHPKLVYFGSHDLKGYGGYFVGIGAKVDNPEFFVNELGYLASAQSGLSIGSKTLDITNGNIAKLEIEVLPRHYFIRTSDEFATIDTLIASGDTIVIREDNDWSKAQRFRFTKNTNKVVITGETEYTSIPNITLQSCQNLTFSNLIFQRPDARALVNIFGPNNNNICIKNCIFRSLERPKQDWTSDQYRNQPEGIVINNSKGIGGNGISIINCLFENLDEGVTLHGYKNILIENCIFDGIYEDAIHIPAQTNSNVIIRGNDFKHFSSLATDHGNPHADAIQIRTDNLTSNSNSWLIEDNAFWIGNGRGEVQCIFIEGGPVHPYRITGLIVRNNYVNSNTAHGITIENAYGALVENNIVIKDTDTGRYKPSISLSQCEDCTVRNNAAPIIRINGDNNRLINNHKWTSNTIAEYDDALQGGGDVFGVNMTNGRAQMMLKIKEKLNF